MSPLSTCIKIFSEQFMFIDLKRNSIKLIFTYRFCYQEHEHCLVFQMILFQMVESFSHYKSQTLNVSQCISTRLVMKIN